MMNLIAITLVATSLLVSGLFSPTPQTNNNNGGPQVIVKEGHRAVVVEYADTTADGNTKVSISPSEPAKGAGSGEDQTSLPPAGVAQEAKDKAKEALSTHGAPHGARELICDAYGKCKHKIAGMWVDTKEKAAGAEDLVGGAVDRAKDLASMAAHKAEERTEGVRENAKEKVREAGETAERVKDKAVETGEKAREMAEKVAGKTGDIAGKTGDMARETAEKVKSKTGEVVEETSEKIKETGRKGKKELSDIAKRAKEVVFDVFGYLFGSDSMSSLMGILQMMGFAMAYGMSVWVTFIMSHVLAGVLPRQQFGMVQSRIYPVYFKAMVASIGLALLGHLLGHRGKLFKNKADMLQGSNLLGSLLLVLANSHILEPRATKVMFERMKLEKEEGRGDHGVTPTRVIDTVLTDSGGPVQTAATATTTTTTTASPTAGRAEQEEAKSKLAKLDDRLKKLNSYSSLLNIGTLMGLTWHLVYLSQRLAANVSS